MSKHNTWTWPLLAALVVAPAALAQTVDRTADGVTVHPQDKGAAAVRVQVVTDNILRVSADPKSDFKRQASLMRVPVEGPAPKFDIKESGTQVRVSAPGISATISTRDGQVAFFDAQGKPLVSEVPGGRSFKPLAEANAGSDLSVRQRFISPNDEAFYGFGQHQQGWMNLKGRDVELAQANIDMAVPFLVSSRNYGVLWDNDSITRLGDPRGLQPLQPALTLYDVNGKEGALTATYSLAGEQKVQRREAEINYQYLKDQSGFPEQAKSKDQREHVTWEGDFVAKTGGHHTFSLYASEYAKLWIDGKLVLDRWRQNWNPWYHDFGMDLVAGKRHHIKVDWDLIEPSYIALLHRDPLPASEAQNLSLWSEAGQMIDYYVVAGADTDAVIAGYRALTGKAVMLPKWAYGFWQSRERYKSQDELVGVLKEYRQRKLPIDNIVLDWSYWPENAWGSHDFDKTHFPDPDGMVDAVHDMHAQIMISIWPKFYPNTANYKELAAAGHMWTRNVEAGEVDWIGKGYLNAFYDAFSVDAQKIYWRQVKDKLNSKGFDAWWMDADEPDIHSNLDMATRKYRITPNALGTSTEYFNAYPLEHTQGVYRGDRETDGKRVFILSRKGYAGTQRNAVAVWSGDVASRWTDLREQISAGVSTSLSGLPNWTFDIGGFAVEKRYENQDPSALAEWRELNTRWFQFGAFVPLFRSHGQFPYREIWNIAPEGTPYYDSMVYYDKLRYTLLPYIYTLAADTWHKDGTILRALPMDFPQDPKVRDINDQYLFGKAFLVSPVGEFKATSRPVYLPKGADWYDFYTGKRQTGGQTVQADAPLQRMPLFVRAGSIVPRTVVQQYVDEQPNAPLTIEVYTGADGQFSLYEDDGRSYNYEQGKFSRIPLVWNQATGELQIGARQGQWDGMQAQREIHVRWISGPRADAGTLEPAADATVRYDGSAQIVKRPAGH